MTTPTEFNPPPEQVEEAAKRMLEQSCTTLTWVMIHDEWRGDLRRYAKWHLTELHRETETLRSQLNALKTQCETLANQVATTAIKAQEEHDALQVQLDRHAGLASQYVGDEQVYGTHKELAGEVSRLTKDKARFSWFIRHLNLDGRGCGCPPIMSVSMRLISNADEDDQVLNLRQLIDDAMEKSK